MNNQRTLAAWFGSLKISRKIAVVAMVSVLATLVFVTLALLGYDFRSSRLVEIERIASISSLIRSSSGASLRFLDPETAEETLSYLDQITNVELAYLFDSEKQLFAQYQGDESVDIDWALLDEEISSDWGNIYSLQSVSIGDEVVGYLYLQASLDRVIEKTSGILLFVLAAVFVSLVISWFVADRMQVVVSKPIQQLVEASKKVIYSKKYDIRVRKTWDDDFGQLVDSFNEMLARIQSRDQKLLKHQQELESIVDDRTKDLKRVNKDLLVAKENAEKASRAKGEFLAVMSHELRTPMNAIVGMTSLLMDTKLNTEQRDFAETIHNSSDSLLNLINDILDFSKIESGKLELEEEPTNLFNCIEESLDLLAMAASEKWLNLTYHIDPDVPWIIHGDRVRLRQVMVNLLSNAIKFTEEGEILIKLEKTGETKKGVELKFSVIDSGIGIPSDKIGILFQDFTQVDVSITRQFGGTGLGLAICKRLVETMGGKIWVESEVGKGSVFHFTICAKVSATRWEPRLLKTQPLIEGRKLLAIDEFENNLNLIESYTKYWGVECIKTSDLEDGMSLLDETPDVSFVIIGLGKSLSERKVIDVIGQKFRNPKFSKIRKILIGQKGTTLSIAESRGFETLLSKPVRPDRLLKVLVEDQKPTDGVVDSIHDEQYYQIHDALKDSRLLLVEDNKVNQKVATLLLSRLGLTADIASDGLEAIEILRNGAYDLILMDIQMPQMDGFTATREIRKMDHKGEEPWIIALTAHATSEFRQFAMDCGMNSFLVKPIRRESLQQALLRYVRHRDDTYSQESKAQ